MLKWSKSTKKNNSETRVAFDLSSDTLSVHTKNEYVLLIIMVCPKQTREILSLVEYIQVV